MYQVKKYDNNSPDTYVLLSHVAYDDNNKEIFGVSHQVKETIEKLGKKVVFVKHSLFGGVPSSIETAKESNTSCILCKGNLLLRALGELYINVQTIEKQEGSVGVIAVDPLNYVALYILSMLLPKKVPHKVFLTIDYSDTRFSNALINSLYHFLDKLARDNAHQVWSVSSRIVKKRRQQGLPEYKNVLVPNSPSFDDVRRRTYDGNHNLIITAVLNDSVFLTPILEAIKTLKSAYPDIHLSIVGSGPKEMELKRQVHATHLNKNVTFYGYRDHSETLDLISSSFLGIALYTSKNKWNFYGDSLKAREYAACGIPIIINTVPSTSEDVASYRAGFVLEKISSEHIAAFIEKCMSDKEYYLNLKLNALKLAKDYDKLKIVRTLIGNGKS